MAQYWESNISSVVDGVENVFATGDTAAQRLVKAKNAIGVEVVGGENVIAGEDFTPVEPLLSKLSVDQKLRIAKLLDLVLGSATDPTGG